MTRNPPGEATALAQPNIALVKYWGKRNDALNLPAVGSLSITLENLRTRTRIVFDPALKADRLSLNGAPADAARVTACLDHLRAIAGTRARASIETQNDFPTAAGLASSASGFAALVVAANAALGLDLSPDALSMYARRGSGSAARSIFGGFVEMARGEREDGADAVARPLLDPSAWPLAVVIAVTSAAPKAVGSSDGMRAAASSPYYAAWVESSAADLAQARSAVTARDFDALADVSEHSCLKMHALGLAARPPLVYWNETTVACVDAVRALRAAGTPVFFTIDAGPQVKAVCLPEAAGEVSSALGGIAGVIEVILSGLGPGARLVENAA